MELNIKIWLFEKKILWNLANLIYFLFYFLLKALCVGWKFIFQVKIQQNIANKRNIVDGHWVTYPMLYTMIINFSPPKCAEWRSRGSKLVLSCLCWKGILEVYFFALHYINEVENLFMKLFSQRTLPCWATFILLAIYIEPKLH
jgi:hypothetical protein